MVHDNTDVFTWSHSKQVKRGSRPRKHLSAADSTAVNLKGTHGAWRGASFCSFYLFFIFPFFFFFKQSVPTYIKQALVFGCFPFRCYRGTWCELHIASLSFFYLVDRTAGPCNVSRSTDEPHATGKSTQRGGERERDGQGNRESSSGGYVCCHLFFTWVQEGEEELLAPFYQTLERSKGTEELVFPSTRWHRLTVTSEVIVPCVCFFVWQHFSKFLKRLFIMTKVIQMWWKTNFHNFLTISPEGKVFTDFNLYEMMLEWFSHVNQ